MATTVFIDPVDTDSWGEQQRAECRAFEPALKDFLTAQRQNVAVRERFHVSQNIRPDELHSLLELARIL